MVCEQGSKLAPAKRQFPWKVSNFEYSWNFATLGNIDLIVLLGGSHVSFLARHVTKYIIIQFGQLYNKSFKPKTSSRAAFPQSGVAKVAQISLLLTSMFGKRT